jgi:16S rRNA (cytidine1402-2'-O)-methyltransferase
VLYESPHRLLKLLANISEVFGEREIICVREATKKFEEIKKGKAGALIEHFKEHHPRGEFVVLLPPRR